MLTFNNYVPLRYTQHFIAGKWEPSVLGSSYINLNPSDENIIGYVADGSAVEISLAARSAHLCFHKIWSKLKPGERNIILFRVGELISNQIDLLANIESMESGRIIRNTKAEIATAADIFRSCQDTSLISIKNLPISSGQNIIFTAAPYGVMGIITDFAGSFLSAAVKVASALGSGNTVVLKPSEHTPCSVLVMAKLCQEAGVPDGAFNVVIGGRKSASALFSHPLVDKFILSGNSSVSINNIMEKDYYLERYETVANVVFHDADLEIASEAVLQCLLFNQGNVGKNKSITFVAKQVFKDFVDRLSEKVNRLKIGDPRCLDTDLGPLISQNELDILHNNIEISLKNGAELITGGQSLRRKTNAGFYYLPTLLINNNSTSNLVTQNIFGPYMEVNPFQRLKDLLMSLRNLGNIKALSLWTTDYQFVDTMRKYINPRYIWVNKCPENDPRLMLEASREQMFKQASIIIDL